MRLQLRQLFVVYCPLPVASRRGGMGYREAAHQKRDPRMANNFLRLTSITPTTREYSRKLPGNHWI